MYVKAPGEWAQWAGRFEKDAPSEGWSSRQKKEVSMRWGDHLQEIAPEEIRRRKRLRGKPAERGWILK